MVEGGKYLGISRTQVSKYIKSGRPYKEFTITKVDGVTVNSPKKAEIKPLNQHILLTNETTRESI